MGYNNSKSDVIKLLNSATINVNGTLYRQLLWLYFGQPYLVFYIPLQSVISSYLHTYTIIGVHIHTNNTELTFYHSENQQSYADTLLYFILQRENTLIFDNGGMCNSVYLLKYHVFDCRS